MSREIKFRGVHPYTKEIMDVCLIDWMHDEVYFEKGSDVSHSIEECKLMQYIGLKNKSGVDICEGDVVVSKQGRHYWVSVISSESGVGGNNLYAMEFCNNVSVDELNDTYTFEVQKSKRRNHIHERMEVIGNIHQNPELLEQL